MTPVRKYLAGAFLVIRVLSCFLTVGFHGAHIVKIVQNRTYYSVWAAKTSSIRRSFENIGFILKG